MHRLAFSGEAETLLGPFVGLNLGLTLSLCHPSSLTLS